MELPEFSNKAYRPGFEPPPYYYVDKQDDYARTVAWSQDAQQMSALTYGLLNTFPSHVDILYMERRTEEHPLDGLYKRYHALLPLSRVMEMLQEHLKFVFTMSDFVLCLRKEGEEEYIALDEYGTLFYYTNSETLFAIFESNGFLRGEQPFVDDGPHYTCSHERWQEWRDQFVHDLTLEPIDNSPMPKVY